MAATWNLKGHLFGSCNCDWGCPCSFDAKPTYTKCQGSYMWAISAGRYDGADLAGLNLTLYADSPGPLHLGNVTLGYIYDERANQTQREALAALTTGREGGPWAVFAAVAGRTLDPLFARYDVTLDGLSSRYRAGTFAEVALAKILNPVRGTPEELRLMKPTGFTSKWADLGRTKTYRIQTPQLSYDHSGQYGEFSEFEYAGP
jgi:hypothetical protein